jgi:hypothetical protein
MQGTRITMTGAILALALSGCANNKQEIPVQGSQLYRVQASGKMKVFVPGSEDVSAGSEPLRRLVVKRKNEAPAAKQSGCWECSDCICSDGDCGCTECTSC